MKPAKVSICVTRTFFLNDSTNACTHASSRRSMIATVYLPMYSSHLTQLLQSQMLAKRMKTATSIAMYPSMYVCRVHASLLMLEHEQAWQAAWSSRV
jgi:hypothetical protein